MHFARFIAKGENPRQKCQRRRAFDSAEIENRRKVKQAERRLNQRKGPGAGKEPLYS
jgi:hypothetical protein